MSATASNPLSSYDLISKSIPGVVLLLIGSSFLPQGAELTGISVGSSIADYAITVVTALILGLFVGEGVHTSAELIEQGILFIGNRVDTVREKLKHRVIVKIRRINRSEEGPIIVINMNLDRLPEPVRDFGGKIRTHVLQPVYSFGFWIVKLVIGWLQVRYWGLHDTLKGHRLLFAQSIIWNFSRESDEESNRWKNRKKGHPYECFRLCVKREFGEDLLKDTSGVDELEQLNLKEQYKSLYTMVSSDVSRADVGLSTRFQAIYSFCRSMYVVFGFVALGYFIVLYPVFFGTGTPLYEPVAMRGFDPSWYPLFVVVPLIASIIFQIATGKYKRIYIDYLISDFCIVNRENLPETETYGS